MNLSSTIWRNAALFGLAFALPLGAQIPGWLDAGASLPATREAARVGVVFDASLDAGASKAAAFAQWRAATEDAASRRVQGELMVGSWRSEKLSSAPDSPFEGWRFRFEAEGESLASVEEFEVGQSGSRPSAIYGILRGEGVLALSRRESGAESRPQSFASLRLKGSAWEVTSADQRSLYVPTEGGGLRIERVSYGRSTAENYLPGGRSTFAREGSNLRQGALDEGKAGRTWVERERGDDQGILDRRYWYKRVEGDSISLVVDEVEPEADLRIEGLSALTSGRDGLENLVVADTIFGPSRRITPVLALAFLGIVPARSR